MLPSGSNIDICALTPLALKLGGLPLSPYYQLIADMSGEIQAFTKINSPENIAPESNMGGFLTKDGRWIDAMAENEISEKLRTYYYMEYNSLQRSVSIERLFEAEK